jgi:hypothetical protein
MPILKALVVTAALVFAPYASAQDGKAWAQGQGLEVLDTKPYQDLEVLVVRGAGADRVVVLRQGKPLWQSNAKDAEPGAKWTVHAVGRDLDGDGQPDLHVSSHSGKVHCCTTHHVLRLKPQVKPIAQFSSGSISGGEFIDVPGRKSAVMVSADDSPADAFAPFATSYFPMVVLEMSPRGRMQLARDLMQSRLPGQPPPVCALPAASANPWLKERCAEYATSRRKARGDEIKTRLSTLKATRAAEKLKWEDYYGSGVLGALGAEVNRYAYTGHGMAGINWLETVWPGNDAVKVRFVTTLRQSQARSPFAEDLRLLAADNR